MAAHDSDLDLVPPTGVLDRDVAVRGLTAELTGLVSSVEVEICLELLEADRTDKNSRTRTRPPARGVGAHGRARAAPDPGLRDADLSQARGRDRERGSIRDRSPPRDARGGCAAAGVFGCLATPLAEPTRQSTAQRRPEPDRDHAASGPRSCQDLRGSQTFRRQEQPARHYCASSDNWEEWSTTRCERTNDPPSRRRLDIGATMAMSAPDLDDTDEASVRAALRSGVLAMAPCAEEFDELAAGVAGTTHAVAVSSALLDPPPALKTNDGDAAAPTARSGSNPATLRRHTSRVSYACRLNGPHLGGGTSCPDHQSPRRSMMSRSG